MKNRDALFRIYRVILSMNQRNRAVSSAYGTEISVGASGVLTELYAAPGLSPGDLATRLMVDKVTITRLLTPLRDSKLLQEKSDTTDGRRKALELTRGGVDALARMRERENAQFGEAYKRLTVKEQKQFSALMRRFLVTFDAIPVVSLKDDPPLMREIRVLSRAIGLLGTRFFCQDQATPLEWHTLAQAHYSPRGVTSKELCIRFLVAATTASSCVARLEKKKLIRRVQRSTDKRMFSLVTTEKGEQFLKQLEAHAVGLLQSFSEHMSTADLDDFAELFSTYSGIGLSADHVVLGDQLLFELVKGEELLPAIRSFIIMSRAAQARTYQSHPLCGSSESYLFTVFHRKELVSVFEFTEPMNRGQIVCLHAFVADPFIGKAKLFVETAVQQLKGLVPSATHFICANADMSPHILKGLESLGALRNAETLTVAL